MIPSFLLNLIKTIVGIIPSWITFISNYISNSILAIILGVACLLLVLWLIFRWLINGLRKSIWETSGKFGPIFIDEVTDKPEIAALMRRYLTDCGAKCSQASAPTASPGFEKVSTALAATSDSNAQLFGVFLTILEFLGIKKIGYTVSCNIKGDEIKHSVNIIVEIKLTYTGQIIGSNSLTGVSNEDAVRKASYWIYWHISGRKNTLQNIPPWYRFPTYEGYQYYKDTENPDDQQAKKSYQEAVKEAPFNALVRLDWGDLNEYENQYLKALEIYIEAVLMWPHLYIFWYRIAVILSSPEEWIESQWQILEPVKKEHLIGLLERLFNNPLIANPAKLPDNISLDKPANENEFIQLGKKYNKLAKEIEFYKLSSDIWAFLEKEINNMFWRWFNQVRTNLSDPLGFTPNLARYYWKLIPPFGWDGQQFRKSVQLAKYCTNVQQKILTDQEIGEKDLKKEIRKIERIVRGWHNKVDIYYNAACYYAQLSVLANKQKQKYITDALKYLKIAFKHQKDLEIVWVQNDPDLKPLKNDPEYQALFVCPNKMEFSNESLDEVDRKGKLYVFELLQKGAGQQIKDWVNLSNNQHSFAVLIIEAEYQIRLWESLIKLLKLPTVQLQQELFWQVAMQKAPNRDIPVHKKDNHKISLKVIDPAWENITNHAQPQIDAWKLRLKDSKLFLNQPVSLKPSEILEMWNQSETWLWEYILQQINKLV